MLERNMFAKLLFFFLSVNALFAAGGDHCTSWREQLPSHFIARHFGGEGRPTQSELLAKVPTALDYAAYYPNGDKHNGLVFMCPEGKRHSLEYYVRSEKLWSVALTSNGLECECISRDRSGYISFSLQKLHSHVQLKYKGVILKTYTLDGSCGSFVNTIEAPQCGFMAQRLGSNYSVDMRVYKVHDRLDLLMNCNIMNDLMGCFLISNLAEESDNFVTLIGLKSILLNPSITAAKQRPDSVRPPSYARVCTKGDCAPILLNSKIHEGEERGAQVVREAERAWTPLSQLMLPIPLGCLKENYRCLQNNRLQTWFVDSKSIMHDGAVALIRHMSKPQYKVENLFVVRCKKSGGAVFLSQSCSGYEIIIDQYVLGCAKAWRPRVVASKNGQRHQIAISWDSETKRAITISIGPGGYLVYYFCNEAGLVSERKDVTLDKMIELGANRRVPLVLNYADDIRSEVLNPQLLEVILPSLGSLFVTTKLTWKVEEGRMQLIYTLLFNCYNPINVTLYDEAVLQNEAGGMCVDAKLRSGGSLTTWGEAHELSVDKVKQGVYSIALKQGEEYQLDGSIFLSGM